MKFIIFAHSYNEDSGGSIVLHKLCHTLNKLGHESYLYPYFHSRLINKKNYLKILFYTFRTIMASILIKYKTNKHFNTPIYKRKKIEDDYAVIYPEVVNGNPLNAKNVVRWLLYEPGGHTGEIFYGRGELYFDFNDLAPNFSYPGSVLSKLKLHLLHIPTEIYNLNKAIPFEKRVGTAYCIRKGINKPIQHDLKDSILIDGRSHYEISNIFKKIKTFISYDSLTTYTLLAALCGAEVIVIPDEGINKNKWRPEEWQRYGAAYGFADNERKWAAETKNLVLSEVLKIEEDVFESVENFIKEVQKYFVIEE